MHTIFRINNVSVITGTLYLILIAILTQIAMTEKTTFYIRKKNGWMEENPLGQYYYDEDKHEFVINNRYRKINNTFWPHLKGGYILYSNGSYIKDKTWTTPPTTTTRTTPPTTTTARVVTLSYPKAQVFQNFYMKELVDDLPPIEKIRNCTLCPRVYIPVCGTDGRSYTNVCRLRCMNRKKPYYRRIRLAYVGICQQYMDPYQY